jgi:pre-mRNA-splicing factor 38A
MANSTDPFAQAVHGTNPQYLVEKITRLKIYNCVYWKEQCFGLTAATIIDKAVALKYVCYIPVFYFSFETLAS